MELGRETRRKLLDKMMAKNFAESPGTLPAGDDDTPPDSDPSQRTAKNLP
jgi:hypothetical protein